MLQNLEKNVQFDASWQWRSEGNWPRGANLNFAPPPQKII